MDHSSMNYYHNETRQHAYLAQKRKWEKKLAVWAAVFYVLLIVAFLLSGEF